VALWPWLVAAAWLLGIEWWLLATGRPTLSRRMVLASRAWPLMPWVMGVVVGGLAVHFWWPWCPP
jgi:hypothetical protein